MKSCSKTRQMVEFVNRIDNRPPFSHAKHSDPKPFFHSPYEIIKTIITSLTLFPMRLALLLLTVIIHYLFLRLLILGSKADFSVQHRDPLSPRRRRIFAVANPVFCRIALFLFGVHRIRIQGEKPSPLFPLVPNHVTYLDLYVLMALGHHDFVVMAEMLQYPLLRFIFIVTNSIFVDREDAESCAAVAEMVVRRNTLPDPPHVRPLTVFPEGTITNQTSVIRFKSGIFRPLTPVNPVAIVYPHRHFNPSNDDMLFGLHLFRCLTQVYNSVTLTYLPATRPQPADSPRTYADRVQHLVADACGLPASPATLEETTAWLAHRHGGLALESALEVVVSRVARHYSVAIPQWDIEECQQR